MLGRLGDDKWPGKPGHRVGYSKGEWPVSYHGNDAQEGYYDLSNGKLFLYGKGSIYIKVAARYAKMFEHKGKEMIRLCSRFE